MTEVDLSDDQECERVLASCKKKWVDYIARKESKTMSDTTEQECVCCGFDTDCIDGLCQPCNDFNYKLEKLHKQVLNKPITEHPDVQRLIGQVENLKQFVQNVADAYATGGDPEYECGMCRGEIQYSAEQALKGE